MKTNIILLIFFTLSSVVLKSQIAIGKTSVNGASTILDFDGETASNSPSDQETTNFRGIILPATDNVPSLASANNGTFLLDKASQKLKMYQNNLWVDLSSAGNTNNLVTNTSNDVGNGVIIGNTTSSASGVLILETPDKAVILPHIKNPHTKVKSPYAGMMCYDTASNTIALFDGTNWNYWK